MRKIIWVFIATVLCTRLALSDTSHRAASVQLSGLKATARIVRDNHGIAHIFATNKRDLFFLQGYVHAQDRLFQMDLSRRQAAGTLAELLGEVALADDVQFRTLGLHRAAQRSLPILSPRVRSIIEAYAEGVNAYVAKHPLPPEYNALELTQFEPWTVLDTITVAKLIAFGFSFDLDDIQRSVTLAGYEAAGSALGFDGRLLFFEDLFRSEPFDPAATVPDATAALKSLKASFNAAVSKAADESVGTPDSRAIVLAEQYLQKVAETHALRWLLQSKKSGGSNQWAIGSRYTTSGLPMLSNDPHLALGVPTTLYPIHLQARRFNVIGSGFAGTPLVVVGHNRFLAWGATFNPLDVTDFYREQVVPDAASPSGFSTLHAGALEPLIVIPEIFRVNRIGNGTSDDIAVVSPGGDIPGFTLIVPRRNMGPLIQVDRSTGVALSVQFTGFSPTRELDAFLRMNEARRIAGFVRGLQLLDFGSLCISVADVRGDIGFFTTAEIPIREDLQNGTVSGAPPFFIRDGSGGNEWLPVQNPQPEQAIPFEILPFSETPQLINPPAGWFVSANNDPAGNTLDNDPLNQLRPGGGIFYLNPGYRSIRAGRVTQLIRAKLDAGDMISFEDMQAIQSDVVLLDAQVFVPYILAALKSAQQRDADPLLAGLLVNNPGVLEAVGRLQAWDFSTPTGIAEGFDADDEAGQRIEPTPSEIDASVAATIYSVWRGRFIANTIDAVLGPAGLPVPEDQLSLSALRNLLDNFDKNGGFGASGLNFFNVPGVSNPEVRRNIVVLQSLVEALALLAGDSFAPAFANSTDQADYRWGLLHRIVLEHPLGGPFNIPPSGGAFAAPLPGLAGIPTDGGFETVDAAIHDARGDSADSFMFDSGPVNRFTAEADSRRGVRAESVWPGGSSGVLGDPNYLNMLPLWLTNDTVPLVFRRSDLR